MEQKFIVRHPVTFELYREWAKNPIAPNIIEKRKKRIRLRVTECVASVFLIVFGALTGKLYLVLIGAVCLVIFLFYLIFSPNRMIKKGYDSVLKVLNGDQWIRAITFFDKIVVEDGRTNIHFEYSEISRVSEDSDYFYLLFHADIAFRVPKESFISGSPDDFREFINSAVTIKAEENEMAEDDLGL